MKFVAEFQNNGKVLDLEGTLEIDYLNFLVSQLTKPRFHRSLVICPRTSTNCQHSRNENLGFLTVVHSISFRILKVSFVVKGNESNNYALLVENKALFKPSIRLQYFFWVFFYSGKKNLLFNNGIIELIRRN